MVLFKTKKYSKVLNEIMDSAINGYDNYGKTCAEEICPLIEYMREKSLQMISWWNDLINLYYEKRRNAKHAKQIIIQIAELVRLVANHTRNYSFQLTARELKMISAIMDYIEDLLDETQFTNDDWSINELESKIEIFKVLLEYNIHTMEDNQYVTLKNWHRGMAFGFQNLSSIISEISENWNDLRSRGLSKSIIKDFFVYLSHNYLKEEERMGLIQEVLDGEKGFIPVITKGMFYYDIQPYTKFTMVNFKGKTYASYCMLPANE